MRRPRILLIHRDLTGLGDTIRIDHILNFLLSRSFDVNEVGLPLVNRAYLTKRRIPIILSNLFPLAKQLRSFRADSLLFFNLMIAKNYLNRLGHNRNFDVILAETSLAGWCALELSINSSVPLIVDVHGLAGFEGAGRGDQGWQAKQLLEKEVFESCHKLLVVSHKMKKCISDNFGVSDNKIAVVQNGADSHALTAQFAQPLSVIFAGHFAYWERIDDFLETAKMANSSDFKFFLAGSGPLQKHAIERIKREFIPVQFLGKVPRTQLISLLPTMQVGLAPSTHDVARQVAFPIKVLDYMAYGLPVVAPNVGDWGKMIEAEGCGIALSDDSINGYVKALESMKNQDSWQEMSAKGVVAIREKYSWESVLGPLESLISNCI